MGEVEKTRICESMEELKSIYLLNAALYIVIKK